MLCFQAQKDYKFNLILLDDRKFQFTYKVTFNFVLKYQSHFYSPFMHTHVIFKGGQRCHQLLSDTVKLFNFCPEEMEYFGFRYIDSNSHAVS